MRRKWVYLICLLAGAAFYFSETAHAQTDVAGSVYGAFAGSTTSGIDLQTPSNSAGGMLEVRHIYSSLVGFEAAYSYNRANQTYGYTVTPTQVACPGIASCYGQPVAVSANEHAITGDWVVSRKMRNFLPFALAGGGLLFVVPSGGQRYTGYRVPGLIYVQIAPGQMFTNSATELMYGFGAGLDWKLSSHIGLRLQDRESMYKSPQLFSAGVYQNGLSSMGNRNGSGLGNTYTYMQEPALGVYYRF